MTKPAKRGKFKTSVGGQAVMEGIMMRGPSKWCLAVRSPSGEIVTEEHDAQKRPWAAWPFVRGVFNFIDSLIMGYSTLMRSAEIAMPQDEDGQSGTPGPVEAFAERHFGEGGQKALMAVSAVLGIALALGLFMFLPSAAVRAASLLVPMGAGVLSAAEGAVKMALFVGYLAAVSRLKDIRRVFSYHGAEHKAIYCYEAGDALTVENIRGHSRFHPRCGTSFLFIVIFISILLNSLLPWPAAVGGVFVRVGLKLLMLPVVMALSYELIRLAGRHDNLLTRIISAPGLWVQRLTTKEPDDLMIEVAVAALVPVLPVEPQAAKW